MDSQFETLRWMDLGVRCPHCGNDGRPGPWEQNGRAPFRVTEYVARMWEFVPKRCGDGPTVVEVDIESDEVVWESGTGLKLLCVGCFAELEISDEVEVDFG